MRDLAIYGAGGFGIEIFNMIEMINRKKPQWRVIGFFDDGLEKGSRNEYGEILGGMDDLNAWPCEIGVVFAIGNPPTLKALVEKVENPLVDFPNIIGLGASAYGNMDDMMGRGNLIGGGCFLSCNVRLGDFNMLNGMVSVGHGAHIGSYNVAMAGAKLSGSITVGDFNLFGCNSFVFQGCKIGNGVRLGPCSALLRNPKDDSVYVGNPAVRMKF